VRPVDLGSSAAAAVLQNKFKRKI